MLFYYSHLCGTLAGSFSRLPLMAKPSVGDEVLQGTVSAETLFDLNKIMINPIAIVDIINHQAKDL